MAVPLDMNKRLLQDFRRVKRGHPCPICERTDWCLVGPDKVICMRIPSSIEWNLGGQPGYLHALSESPDWASSSRPLRESALNQHSRPSMGARQWRALARSFFKKCTDQQRWELGQKLGLTKDSLRAVGTGWDGKAWTFPMWTGNGDVSGILRRFPDGSKKCVKGSRRGIFVPSLNSRLPWETQTVYVVEGPTDVAALLPHGRLAVGRFSNVAGAEDVGTFLANRKVGAVVVIGECDKKPDGLWPGHQGAHRTAQILLKRLGMPIQVAFPPEEHKDVRQWVNAEKDLEEFESRLRYVPIDLED